MYSEAKTIESHQTGFDLKIKEKNELSNKEESLEDSTEVNSEIRNRELPKQDPHQMKGIQTLIPNI